MEIIEFKIPELPKTANALLRKNAVFLKRQERLKWNRLVMYATSGQRPKKPFSRAKLFLSRNSFRAPDYDGLVFSFKLVIDSLKANRIIEDDNMKVIGIPEFFWHYAPKNKGFIYVRIIGYGAHAGIEPDLPGDPP